HHAVPALPTRRSSDLRTVAHENAGVEPPTLSRGAAGFNVVAGMHVAQVEGPHLLARLVLEFRVAVSRDRHAKNGKRIARSVHVVDRKSTRLNSSHQII